MFCENSELFMQRFGSSDSSIKNVNDVTDKNVSYTFQRGQSTYKPTAMELMEYFWASQLRADTPLIENNPGNKEIDADEYNTQSIERIINDLNTNNLVTLNMRQMTSKEGKLQFYGYGHTVLGYKLKDLSAEDLEEENADDGKRILIYDSIYPNEEREILLVKIGEIWRWKYIADENKDEPFRIGTIYRDGEHPNDTIQWSSSIFTMDDFESWFSGVKLSRNKKACEDLLLDTKGATYKLKNQDTDYSYIDLYDYPDANQVLCTGNSENFYKDFYYIPDGLYSFIADDGNKLNLRLSADNFSADIQEAEAESATISLNDEIVEENWIILEAANGKNADIAFHSSHDNNNFDEISIKGKGNKDQVTYTLKSDGNEVHVDGVTLEQIQITVNEDTEEEKVINLPIENGSGNTHTVKVSSAEGKTNIQVLNEKNQVIASTDENGSSGNGNTGDNQGGNTGDNQGGNSGDNQGGNTGDNQGGNSGDNQGGNSGNNQGGNTGGSSGSSSGGSSGGGSGSRRSSGGGSSSSARNGLFITKPSYYGTGTWEGNEASTAWKLKTADGTTLALQWGLIDGIWYLFGMDGYTCTGWQLVNNQWYYFYPNAMMHTGWILLDNHWYYLDSTGAMKTGWVLLDNRWYYLDSTGAMQTGWVFYNNQWYYLNADGSMLVNDSTPDGYAVGADGVWMP